MKRILFCLLVIFLVGCIPLEEIKEEGVEKYVQEGVGFVKEIVANEYKFTAGGSTVVEGIKITLIEITPDYEVKLKVKDIEYTIYETQKREIIDGLDILAKEIKFDPTDKNTYVILKVIKYEAKPNEYLMYLNDEITVEDYTITLLDVDTDKLKSLNLRVHNTDTRINKGKTETLHNLEITNIETNPRAIAFERYAIIKVIPLI